jgi:excisionase family DNA binding protein
MPATVESQQATRDVPTSGGSPLVTQSWAANETGLTRRQIAELVNSGHLASIAIGQRRLIPRWSVNSLLRELRGVAA